MTEQEVQKRDKSVWLIEFRGDGETVYFADDGDWCNNPNHAHRFQTAEQANEKRINLVNPSNFVVREHIWG